MRLQQLTKYAAVTGAVAAVLAAPVAPAQASTDASGSAFAVRATGPVNVPATPSVTSTGKQPVRESVAELPANPLIEASVLNAVAWAGHGRASVSEVKAPKLGLTARAVTAKCDNGNGVSHIVKATLNGRNLAVGARPNSTLSVALNGLGTAQVVLNKQVRDADGRLTVTAVEATVPLGPGRTETISIASVTCGPASSTPAPPPDQPGTPPTSGPAPSPTPPPSQAPAPTPVPGDLPVTG